MKIAYALSLFCVSLLTVAGAQASMSDQAKLARMLGGKTIVCDGSLPVTFSIDRSGKATVANDASRFDSADAEVELSKSWIVLTLTSDTTISTHYHIQYVLDRTGVVSLAAAVLDQADDQAGGQGILSATISCSLK